MLLTALARLGLLLLILASCAPAPGPPAELPVPAAADAVWRHAPSGMDFPPHVSVFARTAIAHLAADGRDAAVSYDSITRDAPVGVTVYLAADPTPATLGLSGDAADLARARDCAAIFDARVRAFAGSFAARRQATRDLRIAIAGRVRSGRRADFTYDTIFAGRRQDVHTVLIRFCGLADGWAFEYRITAPATFDVEGAVILFLRSLVWTGQPAA